MAKIFIYGSCVSRDTFEYLQEHDLVAYIARQSLISAASPATKLLSGGNLDSKFQNRSLAGDLNSSLFSQLGEKANETDYLVVDLIDERLGVFSLPDGTYITHSVELEQSKRLNTLTVRPVRLNLGSDRHYNLWCRAARLFKTELQKYDLFKKTIIIQIPWAERTKQGTAVTAFRQIGSDHMNENLIRYYEYLIYLGFKLIKVPTGYAISTLTHKWGASPFHYADETYAYLARIINSNMEPNN